MQPSPDVPYRVALCDAPSSLPGDARLAAEARYARELERLLGGPYEVTAAFDVMCGMEHADTVSEVEKAVVLRWQRAASTARDRALSHIGEAEEAYFEVRLS